jgi:phage tail tape-measure protein
MNSAMLAATGTAQLAGNEIEFLDQMTSRLGLSLLDTSDAYTKFLFASKGKLDQSETRELFEGLSELGTTLGVSKERMKLSMNAITQMINKGKISSEELRLQLAESLPGK